MDKRARIKKLCYETNNVGKRLAWVRTKLKLSLTEVCSDTGIPYSSMHDRETSFRSTYYEEMLILAHYYNNKWQERFNLYKPVYDNSLVEAVTFPWICLGFDPSEEYNRALIEEIEKDYRQREYKYAEENLVLKNQLSLFKGQND